MENKLSLEMLNNVSEIDVVYKRKVAVKVSERPLIRTSKDCYDILKTTGTKKRLTFWKSSRYYF